jgi:hypothetical protein
VKRTFAAVAALFLVSLLAPSGALARSAGPLPPRPSAWPDTLQLGVIDREHDAAALRASSPYTLRYHYLSGGVNTGGGWQSWAEGNGSYVTDYVTESLANGFTPVFSYYQLLQSAPASGTGDEQRGFQQNLRSTDTMRSWFDDLRVFFQRAGAFGPNLVVLQVEPDFWGFAQKGGGDDAGRIAAQVSATGAPELTGLPNTVAGLAQAVVRLRDTYAPNVLLGYPLSIFGTNVDLAINDPPKREVDALALRSARFFRSLHARFDVAFGEFSNADSAYRVKVRGEPASSAWWNSADFARHARFLGDFSRRAGLRVVLWQIPAGNSRLNDTYGHYADNRAQWLLGDGPGYAHLRAYERAGVIALLFGNGVSGATCPCDAVGDGADDDGGLLRQLAGSYYAAGPLALP